MAGKTILGLHFRETKNIGDRYCHPLDYFHFARSIDDVVIKADVRDPPRELRPDIVVLGGGAIARHAPDVLEIYAGATFIGWGIGSTNKNLEPVDEALHTRFSKNYQLWGARDFNAALHTRIDFNYTPCVSCMHPFFDAPPPARHAAVVYGHAGKRPLRDEAAALGIPYMENNDKTGFYGALEHLASGETVITSSYHGAYWATLLGRRVSMLPFGSKFFSLRYRPSIVDSIEQGIHDAVAFSEALEDCRATTESFAAKVHNLIWDNR